VLSKEDATKRILEVTLSPGQDMTWRREVVRSCLEGYAEACMYVMRNRFDLATNAALEAAIKDMQEG
jgi:sugar phosphate permease